MRILTFLGIFPLMALSLCGGWDARLAASYLDASQQESLRWPAVRRLGRAAGGELSGCEATGVASMAAGEGHRRNVPVLPHWGDLFAGAARLAPGAGREPPDFVRDRAARRVAGQSRSTGGEGGLPRFCG